MSKPDNESRFEKLQRLQESYDAMRIAPMTDFADDYDDQLDGIDVVLPDDLREYVKDLIELRKEAAKKELNPEEQQMFVELLQRMKNEQEMTAIHKMLQYTMLSALVDSAAAPDGNGFQDAVECEKFARLITSDKIREELSAQGEYSLDDGGLNKTALRKAEKLLEKEQQLEKHPLTDACLAVINNRENEDSRRLFTSNFLKPYIKTCMRNLKMEEEASAMREDPVSDEQKRLEKSIEDLARQSSDVNRKISSLKEEVVDEKSIRQLNKDIQADKKRMDRTKNNVKVIFSAEKISIAEKAASMDRHKKNEKQRSREFRDMKRVLNSLVSSDKTDIDAFYKNAKQAYDLTTAYIQKREAGSFWSRHFGESGKRYKKAVETQRILRDCCVVYADYQEELQQQLGNERKLEAMKNKRKELKFAEKQMWDIENRTYELQGNISEMKKDGKQKINFEQLQKKLDGIELQERHRSGVLDHGNVKKEAKNINVSPEMNKAARNNGL